MLFRWLWKDWKVYVKCAGGNPWTVIPVEKRKDYMGAYSKLDIPTNQPPVLRMKLTPQFDLLNLDDHSLFFALQSQVSF